MSTETKERSFDGVLNEWTDACLDENRKASIPEVALILRLGTLGQRLIAEAHSQGMRDIQKLAKGEGQ